MNNLISIPDLNASLKKEYIIYVKYVRTQEYGYRFALGTGYWAPNHNQMFPPEEKPISAGLFKLYRDKIVMENGWSTTLKIGEAADDLDNLSKMFEKPVASKWE